MEIIAFVIILFIYLFIIAIQEPAEPTEFVTNKTILNYSNLFFTYKIIKYPTNVEIVSPLKGNVTLGFVTDPWNLNFGIVPGNGSYVKRFISVTNLKEKYNKIKLKTYGNITLLVNFSKNDFVLNESAAIEVNLYTDTAEFGNYSGEIDVIIKVPKYDLLKVLL
jgi:hypothetical protein